MNVKRMNKLADYLEKLPTRKGKPRVGFNMAAWDEHAEGTILDRSGHNCGTVCCIGGWAERIWKEEATFALGLDQNQEDRLFFNFGQYVSNSFLSAIQIPEAVAAIRKMVREEA